MSKDKKKEMLDAVQKNGMKAVVGVVGSGMSAKKLVDAMAQTGNNMKKTGIEKL